MTKRDLVTRVARQTGRPRQDVAEFLDLFLEGIIESLAAGETIEFRKFGVFTIEKRRSRIGRNPKQPQNTVVIPERRVVKFKPGLLMRQKVTGA